MKAPMNQIDHSLAVSLTAARAADSKKADDVIVRDVRAVVDSYDFIVVCSASNPRLVGAIAQEVEDHVAIEFDRRPNSVEGNDERRWVVLDYGDVVVHVFLEEERSFYRLERLFGDAADVVWREAAATGAV